MIDFFVFVMTSFKNSGETTGGAFKYSSFSGENQCMNRKLKGHKDAAADGMTSSMMGHSSFWPHPTKTFRTHLSSSVPSVKWGERPVLFGKSGLCLLGGEGP